MAEDHIYRKRVSEVVDDIESLIDARIQVFESNKAFYRSSIKENETLISSIISMLERVSEETRNKTIREIDKASLAGLPGY
jgi:hypothetical protein